MAYDQFDPIGAQRIDYAAANVAHVIANVNRDKGNRAYTITDFLPPWLKESKPEQSAQEQIALARAITDFLGGQTKEKGT